MTVPADPYEAIAPEYYDPVRHPTSANFRFASRLLLAELLPALLTESSDVLEVGCGDSALIEVMDEFRLKARRAVLTDASRTMLRYSSHWRRPGVELLVADAEALPFADSSFDLAVSILGDPYNTSTFWGEMARVVRASGSVLYTTPSYRWSVSFRGPTPRAVFDPAHGRDLAVASFVLSEHDQRALIRKAGLTVTRVLDVPRSWLPKDSISRKLGVLKSPDDPVVTAYVATKSPKP